MSGGVQETLLLPFDRGLPVPEGRALFLNARAGPAIRRFPGIEAQQYSHAAAATAGCGPEIPDGPFALALVLGSKQRDETLFYLGSALERLRSGGLLLCAAAGDEGGRRLEGDFAQAGLSAQSLSKNRARVVWAVKGAGGGGETARVWIAAGAQRRVPGTGFVSQPGVFCWDRVDAGSALLAAHLPEDFAGPGADFGCGFGFLAARVLETCPRAGPVFCIDDDWRAVRACRENTAAFAGRAECLWGDLGGTVPAPALPPLGWIVMNPPFHAGKKNVPELGISFINRAAAALKPGGDLWLVANAHLPYEGALGAGFTQARRVAQDKGFKVIHAKKGI